MPTYLRYVQDRVDALPDSLQEELPLAMEA